MANQSLDELPLLDVSSVTNIESFFLYGVHNDTPYVVDGSTLSESILGGTAEFAVKYRTQSWDITRDIQTPIRWTNTMTDTYGFVDAGSNTLFRMPDDRFTHVQLLYQICMEADTNTAFRYGTIHAGGLPGGTGRFSPQQLEDWPSGQSVYWVGQTVSPIFEVQSGSYFYASLQHNSSIAQRQAVSQFKSSQARENFFAIWAWTRA